MTEIQSEIQNEIQNENRTPDLCEVFSQNDVLEQRVRSSMPEEEILYSLADLYKVFGDSTRIRILYALLESEMCVCDLAGVLDMTVSAVSHQLKVLKQAKLVSSKRSGKSVIYSLADDHVKTILNQGIDHVCEDGEEKRRLL